MSDFNEDEDNVAMVIKALDDAVAHGTWLSEEEVVTTLRSALEESSPYYDFSLCDEYLNSARHLTRVAQAYKDNAERFTWDPPYQMEALKAVTAARESIKDFTPVAISMLTAWSETFVAALKPEQDAKKFLADLMKPGPR